MIIVKVYEMAKGAIGRDDYDETVVRKATLEYARSEILALVPEPKDEPPLLNYQQLAELKGNQWIDGRWYYNPYEVARNQRKLCIKHYEEK